MSLVYADPRMDESRWIDKALQTLGGPHRRHRLEPEEAWELTGAAVKAQGEPLLGWDLVAQYRAYALAREAGLTVVLEGHGPDEVLGGYALFEGVLLRDLLARGRLRDAALEVDALGRRDGVSWGAVTRTRILGPLRHRLRWVVGVRPGDLRFLRRWDAGGEPESNGTGTGTAMGTALGRVLSDVTFRSNLPFVLLHTDRSSMAHGIETRVPYLDHALVELCFELPDSCKVHRGVRKRVLREVARSLVAPEIVDRRDKRAMVSTTSWMPLRSHPDVLGRLASDPGLGAVPFVDPAGIDRVVSDYLTGRRDDALGVWRLHTAARWIRDFEPRM